MKTPRLTRSLQTIALILACVGVAKIRHAPAEGTIFVIVAIIGMAASWFLKPPTHKTIKPEDYHF